MMLASGQVVMGAAKQPQAHFGLESHSQSDQIAPKRQRTTRATRRCVASFLVTFRRSSFYFLRCGGLERHAAKPHLTTSTTSSRFRAAFQRRRPEA